jgi:heme A synthase
MKQLGRAALAADALALMTLVLGSWTRINGAGLTCPDWPLCHGRILPSLADGTLWEWTHRLLATSLAAAMLAIVAIAWKKRSRSPFITPTLATIISLFLLQIVLGAQTVWLSNTPLSVVLHWATAIALIAALSAMAIFAAACDEVPARIRDASRASRIQLAALVTTAAAAFVTMCIGAYVSSSGAGLACLSIPGCAGNVVVYTPGQFVQMVHRIAAGATLLSAVAAFAVAWGYAASARLRVAVTLGVTLIFLQILLGLLNVAFRLPSDLREAHAVNAALLFVTFFMGSMFAMLDAPLQHRSTLIETQSS